ncbi:MAG: methyltransferase domain-containing protein [Phycisphaerae bacterium]
MAGVRNSSTLSNCPLVRRRTARVRKCGDLRISHDIVLPLSDTSSHELSTRRAEASNQGFATVKRTLVGGETIVEIGCGRGLQSIEMAKLVGPRGRLVSIDSSPDAINAARRNAADAGIKNVEFYLCRVDSVPLPPGLADWIISEGVFCPSSGKMAVFREMFRVLAPGGRILIHDIAIRKLLPPEIADSISAFTFGLAGAIELSSYRKLLNSTGFDRCEITESSGNSHVERFWDSAVPNPSRQVQAVASTASLPHLTSRHWLHEYVAGIRLQARKPILSAACA